MGITPHAGFKRESSRSEVNEDATIPEVKERTIPISMYRKLDVGVLLLCFERLTDRDPDRPLDRHDVDVAIPENSGLAPFRDRAGKQVHLVVFDHDLEQDPGLDVSSHDTPTLVSLSPDLREGHAFEPAVKEGFPHRFHLFRLDDCSYQFHDTHFCLSQRSLALHVSRPLVFLIRYPGSNRPVDATARTQGRVTG